MRLRKPILLIHAGAGTWRYESIPRIQRVLKEAVMGGFKLIRSGSAIDAVVEAVKIMEDSGVLNAGLGSVTDVLGRVSMDAGIMVSDGRIGAVANVKYPQNPILLARYVMEETDHVLIVGEGADELASRLGLKRHPGPPESIRRRYEELLTKALKGEVRPLFKRNIELARRLWGIGDTVGAVAIDSNNVLAAAVSTGGVIMKLPGRVGDSAIPGAGFYSSGSAAAVATGIGETIIKSFLTLRLVELVKSGLSADEAAREVIRIHTERFGKDNAGVIAVDVNGFIGVAYNTKAMPWAVMSGDGKVVIGGYERLFNE